ncbi:hypothetical protein [Cupriavidus plantarum]|uniref:hypothetical protein n=1 Tax=Cupriavidus plantarum TaxID=942865 RepID=UPI000F131E52|nr:hypothetical protein [Cupriavidus plantarum]RLK39496.1 hypothetical protein C7417_3034 [Cupriavidus plantarum]
MLMLANALAQPAATPNIAPDARRHRVVACLQSLSDRTDRRTLGTRCGGPGQDPVAYYAAARACARVSAWRMHRAGARERRDTALCSVVRVQLLIALYRLMTSDLWDIAAFDALLTRVGLGQPADIGSPWAVQFEHTVRDHMRDTGTSWRDPLHLAFRYAATVAAGLQVDVVPPNPPMPREFCASPGWRNRALVHPFTLDAAGNRMPLERIRLDLVHFEMDHVEEWQARDADRDSRLLRAVASAWHDEYARAAADETHPAAVRALARASRWHAFMVREQVPLQDPSEVYLRLSIDGETLAILRATTIEDPDGPSNVRDSIIEDILLAPAHALTLPGQSRTFDLDSFAIQAYLDFAEQERHATVTLPASNTTEADRAYRNGFREVCEDASTAPPASERQRNDDEL